MPGSHHLAVRKGPDKVAKHVLIDAGFMAESAIHAIGGGPTARFKHGINVRVLRRGYFARARQQELSYVRLEC